MSRGATRRHGVAVGVGVRVGSGAGVRVGSGVGALVGAGVTGGVGIASGLDDPGSAPPGSPAVSPATSPRPGAAVGRAVAAADAAGAGGAAVAPEASAPSARAPGVPAMPATSPAGGPAGRGMNANAVAPSASRLAMAARAAARGACLGVGRAARGASETVAARSAPRNERSTDVVAILTPHAGHAPTDRAQQRWQAWIPHALHVVRPARCRPPPGRAGLPQRSQKRSGAPSAEAAAQGSIIGPTQPSRRPRRLIQTGRSDRFGECSARTPRRLAPVAPCTRTP
jgi:hypothetical protein